MDPTFFKTQALFRKWLEKNHATAPELYVGFHKKGTGRLSITYREALDEALCFGWIDGVRKSIDAESYMQRFTPRRPGSVWSLVNIKRVEELKKLRRMHPAGFKAFETRNVEKALQHSHDRVNTDLSAAFQRRFKSNKMAWDFFGTQPPGYRKIASWWVMSAKREETREKRLNALIDDCANGLRLAPLTPPGTRRKT